MSCRREGLLSAWMLGCFLLSACTNAPPTPVPVQVHFLGRVKLAHPTTAQRPETPPSTDAVAPASTPVLPTFLPKSGLSLLFDPAVPNTGQCDPFAGGGLQLKLLAPDGKEFIQQQHTLQPPFIVPTSPGYRMPTLEGFELPPQAGRWQLVLTWQCLGKHTPRVEVLPFQVHGLDPVLQQTLDALKQAESSAAPDAQLVAYETAISQSTTSEARLWLLKNEVQLLRRQGEYVSAELKALSWADAAMEAGFPSEAMMAFNAAYEAARDRQALISAWQHQERALTLTRQYDFEVRLGEELLSRAILHERLGQLTIALEAAAEARIAARRAGKPLIESHAEQVELELSQSLGHHTQVRAQLKRYFDAPPPDDPDLLNNRAWLILRDLEAGAARTRALEVAEQWFSLALQAYEKAQNPEYAASTLANLAEVSLLRADLDTTRARLAQARAKGSAEARLLLFLQWIEADVSLAEGHASQALTRFMALEQAANAASAPEATLEYLGRAAFGQGQAHEALQHHADAEAAYARALSLLEGDAAKTSPLHRASLLANRPHWEEAAVRHLLKQGKSLEALTLVESGLQARRQTLQRAARQDALSPETQTRLHHLRLQLDSIDQSLTRLRQLPTVPAILAQREQLETQRQKTWAESEALLSLTPSAPALDVRRLQAQLRQLPENTQIIRISAFPSTRVRWTLSRTGIEVDEQPIARAQLDDWIAEFVAGARAGTPAREAGMALSRHLLTDLRNGQDGPYKPPSRLVFVVEGALRNLPWGLLPIPDTGATPPTRSEAILLDSTVVSLLPSLDALTISGPPPLSPDAGPASDTTRPPDSPSAQLIVADPTRNLSAAEAEGRQVAAQLPGAEVWTQEAVTRRALLDRLPRVSLFHYAGHGRAVAAQPYRSHLELNRGEHLSLMDIRGLSLNAPMVFLNACSAGEVLEEGGGALGLADGFFAAGAQSVIASLWSVPDALGGALAEAFYHQLRQQTSDKTRESTRANDRTARTAADIPALLQAAQKELRATGKLSRAEAAQLGGYLVLTGQVPSR